MSTPYLDPDRPLYPIGVVAEILRIPQRILRAYDEKGIVTATRTVTNRRLYSLRDMQKIEYVDYLTHVRRVNLAGVREIFNLLDQMTEEKREEVMSRSGVAPRTPGKEGSP